MVADGDFVAIFNSIHRVMKAERLLKDRRLPILVIPAPRSVNTDCGLAIRYGTDARDEVERVLSENGLIPERVFVKQGDEYLDQVKTPEKGRE